MLEVGSYTQGALLGVVPKSDDKKSPATFVCRCLGTMATRQHLCPQIAHHGSLHETDQHTGSATQLLCKILGATAYPVERPEIGTSMLRDKGVNKESTKGADTCAHACTCPCVFSGI